MRTHLLRDLKFLAAVIFLVGLLILSIGNTVFNDGKITITNMILDEKAEVVSVPPYTPLEEPPLGTDHYGYDMLHMIIQGAKFTLGAGLFIAIIRVLISGSIGMIVSTYIPKAIPILRVIAEPFSIVPQTLIAFFILFNVLWMRRGLFEHPLWDRIWFEVIILTIIALPTLSLQLTSQMRKLWSQEYIESALILGGSKWHVFWKHILPNVQDKIILLIVQQFIVALIILAHLGVLQLFFGGTVTGEDQPPKTLTYEWAGIVGDSYQFLRHYPWIPFIPIIFFALSILSLSTILESLKKAFRLKDEGKI